MPDVVTTVVPASVGMARPGRLVGANVTPTERRRLVAAALMVGDLVTLTIINGLLQLGAAMVVSDTDTNMASLMLVWALALCGALGGFGLYGSDRAEPVDRLRRRTLGLGAVWAAVAIVLVLRLPEVQPLLGTVSLFYPLYYIGASLVYHRQG